MNKYSGASLLIIEETNEATFTRRVNQVLDDEQLVVVHIELSHHILDMDNGIASHRENKYTAMILLK